MDFGSTPKSFTMRSKGGLLRSLITKIGISPPTEKITNTIVAPKHFFNGVWDTGATSSAISTKAANDLGLVAIGKEEVRTANNTNLASVYLVDLFLPNGICIGPMRVTEFPHIAGAGIDLLIGMDVISRGDFCVTNYKNNTVFTFRMPSLIEIDFTKDNSVNLDQQKNNNLPIQARNSLCNCGSGKKYKQCHGK